MESITVEQSTTPAPKIVQAPVEPESGTVLPVAPLAQTVPAEPAAIAPKVVDAPRTAPSDSPSP
jgi:hypothetical protein